MTEHESTTAADAARKRLVARVREQLVELDRQGDYEHEELAAGSRPLRQ